MGWEREGEGGLYQVWEETGEKSIGPEQMEICCSRVGVVGVEPLESARDLGCERLPGLIRDDLSQNAQWWGDGT